MPQIESLDDIPDVIPPGPVYLVMAESPGELPVAAPKYQSVIHFGETGPDGYITVPPCMIVWQGKVGRGICLREAGHDDHHVTFYEADDGVERVVAVWGNHPDQDVPYMFAVRYLGMEDWLGAEGQARPHVPPRVQG